MSEIIWIYFFHYVIIVFCAFLEIPCKIKPEAKSLSHEATHRNIIQGGSLRLLGAVTTANKEFLEKGPSRFFYQVEIKGRAVKYTKSICDVKIYFLEWKTYGKP